MHTDVAAIGGRVARLVLLACTLFGLAAMHTLGHGASHHGEPAAAATLFAVVTPAAPHDCGADGCSRAVARLAGHGMNGWDLCVAVLSAFAIAALVAALLLTVAAGRSPRRSPRGHGRMSPRAPPTLSFGLTLATVSVLRT